MSSSTPEGGEAAGGQSTSPSGGDHRNEPPPTPIRHSKLGDLHILGQHEAVLYHGDDVITSVTAPTEGSEEDDSFFEVEVSLNDVKSMFKDLQRRRYKEPLIKKEDLEDAPFKGQKLRALEKENAELKSLHDHPNTAIRIRFPDRTIMQGIFRTSDTISSLKSWLREYLHDPTLEFYLFTAPPKNVLQDDVKLVEAGLVAMVVIYFGSQNMPESNRVLKPDFYSKLSDPEKVFNLAKHKLKVRKRESEGDDGDIKPSNETQLKDHSKDTSQPQQPVRRPVDKGTVPKWFKLK